MRAKTAASTVTQLALLGCVAAVAGCSTQPDAQPDQFNAAPVIEAVYARDSAASAFGLGALPDVQVWANPADPHYPSQVGETGQQNAANVSKFPASYGGIVVEFNITLDGTKFGVQNDLGTYCSDGSNPDNAPFKLVDTDDSSRVLSGSICYDPTSPLYRYPSLTFVIGSGVADDASAQPFTCNSFNPSAFDSPSGTALVPTHHYALVFNGSEIVSQAGKQVSLPSGDAAFTNGTFAFQASGFDIMAAGYQDQSTGYYTFIDKPYAGFLKDLAAVGAAGYQQPADDTPFFVITTYPYNADSNCVPASADDSAQVTATRADGSSFSGLVFDDFCIGGLISEDPRIIYVTPALGVPGFDGAVNGGSGTWEPGQSYKVTIPASLADSLAMGTTLGTEKDYTFSAAAGDPTATQSSPIDGAVAQLVYAKNGPSTLAEIFLGASPLSSTTPSWITVNFNVPVDPATVTTDNFKVVGPDGSAVAGMVLQPAGTNEQAVAFQPSAPLQSSTLYHVTVSGLKADASVVGFTSGPAIPTYTAAFTTSTMRSSSFARLCTTGPVPGSSTDGCLSSVYASADRAANQPLQILKDGDTYISYTRESANVDNTTVQIIEGNDITAAPLSSALVGVTPSTTNKFVFYLSTDSTYPIKCNTHYFVRSEGKGSSAANPIVDTDETPAQQLSYEGCKSGDCSDLRTFTTQPFELQPLDTAGNVILYTPPGGDLPIVSQSTADGKATLDTISVQFNATPDHNAINALITANNFIQVTDANGAAVQFNCPTLPDDDSIYEIDCTAAAPLASNATYFASLVLSTPVPIAAQTTLTPQLIEAGGQLESATPSTPFPGDQTSCTVAGSFAIEFTTPCGSVPPLRSVHHAHGKVAPSPVSDHVTPRAARTFAAR